ncbi:MAG: WYL domain-containing protein, partial [Microbacteriaceae bacterium]
MNEAAGSASFRKVTASDRHFALVLALLWTDRGLSKEEIYEQVSGYQSSPDKQTDPASLDRMFERDKKSLAEVGIQVQTLEDRESKEGQILYRYVVPKSAYRLPDEVNFNSEEVMLLKLAGRVWQGESMVHEVSRALTKVQAQGV